MNETDSVLKLQFSESLKDKKETSQINWNFYLDLEEYNRDLFGGLNIYFELDEDYDQDDNDSIQIVNEIDQATLMTCDIKDFKKVEDFINMLLKQIGN